MIDPFFPPLPFLKEAVTPLCESLHLYSLPNHIHEVLFAAALYHIIFEYLASPLSTLLLSSHYTTLGRESRLRWNMHCASMAQSLVITSLALYVIWNDDERRGMDLEERMWGYTGAAAMVQAFATGYFLFDLIVMVRFQDVFGTSMLCHALACVITYTLGFRPIFNYYGCVFMLYELSTPFLNIHWFCDKLGMTGSRLQLYNGILLIVVFFSCRLVWGAYSSFNIYADVLKSWDMWGVEKQYVVTITEAKLMRFGRDRSAPLWVLGIYLTGHVVLQCLNVFWFKKMIAAVTKRFRVAEEKKKD